MKKVSIKDVAREAGVSVTAVSHILNDNKQRFSQGTIKKVLDAKEKLGYIPNKNAQQLRGSKTKMIGVLLPSLTNPFFSTIIQSMDEHKPDNVEIIFLTTINKGLEENIKHLVEHGVDGLVIGRLIDEPENLNAYLTKHKIPYVVLDQSEDNGFTDIIRTNEHEGGKSAAKHLIDYGHTNLAIIQPYELMANMKNRIDGFEQYCGVHNIPNPKKINTELSKLGGKNAVNQLISQEVTGIFAINDEIAIGAIRALIDNNFAVPDDISIIGYDDIDFAQYMNPALTTIAQPIDEIGKVALHQILKKVEGLSSKTEKIELPTQLIVRETTQSLK
ncbi:LacI family DNA-binding transcriptional regulator [Staphylococcus sp. 18_1_E_LY]|uniref:LacI family DNA-binding transcriptional regulator n=1 Tax=Staphylococcus lloydii TaxID=2781774 RepID=A0A7T1FA33_9STAP|nr:LacI family DNA-binding transcriptional regulator [Staphylococcus lloydii]MBF7019942.1 LacI family DNA-binding transcriptional regulator [Staphylococcus lloydii]MBF7027625.1 LacI family DNA-binding transcriptional regulator [Staphylococcus lloydii]QPM75310.1 LacI family DNA-binding transcriptional regulator [Staphylococcus lloydii]